MGYLIPPPPSEAPAQPLPGKPPENASNVWLSRIRVNASGDVGDRLGYFVQFQDSRWFGEEGTPATDLQGVDLHEGYVDIRKAGADALSLRVGRWAMQYGDQRLISPLDWNGIGRSWDGARIRWQRDRYMADLFSTVIARPETETVDDAETFSGFYSIWTASESLTAEIYGLWKRVGPPIDRYSLGAHLKGKIGRLGYNAEGVYQLGSIDAASPGAEDRKIDAYGAVLGADVELGDTFGAACEWTYASGDDDPTDDTAASFDPLYPFAHAYQGYLDIFAWKNGHDFMLRVSARRDKTQLALDAHAFLLDTEKDAWYGAGGAPLRSGAAGTRVGQEIDLHVKHPLTDGVGLWAGYSRFFADEVVDDTGGGEDMDWAFLQLTADF